MLELFSPFVIETLGSAKIALKCPVAEVIIERSVQVSTYPDISPQVYLYGLTVYDSQNAPSEARKDRRASRPDLRECMDTTNG